MGEQLSHHSHLVDGPPGYVQREGPKCWLSWPLAHGGFCRVWVGLAPLVTHSYRKPFTQIESLTTAFHWLWFGRRCTRLGPEEDVIHKSC